ncbi:MAG: nucleotide-binding universal stress UspA family protein [Saprospiraceae bacterium]|jgi:nucleotide-binding universal stress UspA family protein
MCSIFRIKQLKNQIMKKILIPTDLSDLGDYAYGLAKKIAAPTNAEIHVLSIVAATSLILFDKEGIVKDCGDQNLTVLRQQEKETIAKMEKWVLGKEDIKTTKVKIGIVEDDILRYAAQNDIDLIVMGTHGVYGIGEALRGSHAGHISLKSSVPVLSLKCDRSEMKINDLLFVCDFHKPEKIDLTMLKTFQDVFDAKINLLKVNTPKDFEPQKQVIAKMQEFTDLNELGDVYFNVYSDESVEKGIVNFSADTGIDFVTIGTHQRSGLSRLLKKSISIEIVNHLWQPVLTFPVG